MREEPVATAAIVLAVLLVFDAAGIVLFLLGGVAVLFAIALLAFGVMGMAQAVLIAFGRQPPPEQGRDDERRRPR